MSAAVRAQRPRAPPFIDPPGCARQRPEATLLHQLVEWHDPALCEQRAEAGRPLPEYVQQEFEAYLKCVRLEEGFLRVRCEQCHAEKLVAFSCKKHGFCPCCGAQSMGETAVLLADEVLPERPLRQWVLSLPYALRFLLASNPAVVTLVLGVAYRTISCLAAAPGRTHACQHSITYRITVGPRVGQKLFTLLLVRPPEAAGDPSGALRAGGFSLHASAAIAPDKRGKLERLCRHVSLPPIATERLALTASGQVRYALKTPYRNGTTHIVLEPLELMARLAALVPPPRMHLTRYHGVLAERAADAAGLEPCAPGAVDSGCGPGHQRPTGAAAGLAGGRACPASPFDARLALTIRPVTRTRIGRTGGLEFPIRLRRSAPADASMLQIVLPEMRHLT